jgi:phage gpG-like protein
MARNRGGTESIKRKIAKLNGLKTTMPDILANDSVNFFKKSFRKQGWEDTGVQRWKPRKGNKDAGRGTLIKTGDLVKSLSVESANWKKIRIVSALPYSAIHNEGLKGKAFGKHPFTMPKRKFMGRSRKLHSLLRNRIETKLNFVMKS